MGMEKAPVVYIDVSEQEAKALNLALNRIQGQWDLPKLGELLQELQGLPDLDETLTGFDHEEMDSLLVELEEQQRPPYHEDFDLAAALEQAERARGPTRVKAGDLWQLGRHRLLCGDSLETDNLKRVCEGRPVDLVLTDPPYGIDYQSTMPRPSRRKEKLCNDEPESHQQFLHKALPAIREVMGKGSVIYWFAGGGGPSPALAKVITAIDRHFNLINCLVWDKETPGLNWRWRYSWEAIVEAAVGEPKVWHGGHDRRNVLRCPKIIPQAGDHPTPKPVPLLEELITASAPTKGRILDPFVGSGSALIATERTGRTCLALEIEPRYCDIVLARWEALSGEKGEKMSA